MADIDVDVSNGPITVDSDTTVEIKGLNDIKVTAKLEPTPFKTESKQELILPQPLKTETKLDTTSDIDLTTDSKSAMLVDLKPVAMDVCLNTSSKLPQGQIYSPFTFHLGLTWFGVEFFGLNLGGETRTVLQDLPKKPLIDWPAQQNAPVSPSPPYHDESVPGSRDRGLKVRIK